MIKKLLSYIVLGLIVVIATGCGGGGGSHKMFDKKIVAYNENTKFFRIKIPDEYVSGYRSFPDGSASVEIKFKLSNMQPAKHGYVKENNENLSISIRNTYVKNIDAAASYQRLTKIESRDNGLIYYKDFGCDLREYSETLFRSHGCVDVSANEYYVPKFSESSNFFIINCIKNCAAYAVYKNFDVSIYFGRSHIDKWKNIEKISFSMLDKYVSVISDGKD